MDFNILNQEFLNNSALVWLYALGIFVGLSVLVVLIFKVIVSRIEKLSATTSNDFDDIIAGALQKIHIFTICFVALFFASLKLNLPENAELILSKLVIFVLLFQVGSTCSYIASKLISKRIRKRGGSHSAENFLTLLAKIIIWSIVVILVLDNLGVDVTALVAGLGIGGIAIALAVQNVLSDLLASLSILLDKPFEEGDFIIVDDLMGNVEQIGIKTTRLRSISGEQLILNNSDLLNSRIKNYKRMQERRIIFSLGVTYQTNFEQLKTIPGMIESIIKAQEKARFDRCHFKSFDDSALTFETVFYVEVPEYSEYMDMQEKINLDIFKEFEESNIEFAYPTQTIFFEQNNS